MSSSDSADAVLEILRRHFARSTDALRPLVTDEIIAEHRMGPLAPGKSPALLHVLDVMRQAPIAGKLAILARSAGEEYQVIRLSGEYADTNDLSDRRRYSSENDALHEVFLRRLDELGLRDRSTIRAESDVASWVADQAGIDAFEMSLERYVIGYLDRPAALPGESITLHASSDSEIRVSADLVELGHGDATGAVRERVVMELGEITVRHRLTSIGSTAVVSDLGDLRTLARTVGLTIMPTFLGAEQTIASQETGDGTGTGWELSLDDGGRIVLDVRGIYDQFQRLECPELLSRGVWYSIAVTFGDGRIDLAVRSVTSTAAAWGAEKHVIDRTVSASAVLSASTFAMPDAPLRFAARTLPEGWERCFDGKIEAPYLLTSLDATAAAAHRAGLGRIEELSGLLVSWRAASALSDPETVGRVIPARGPSDEHLDRFDATCRNTPSWGVTSSDWDGSVAGFPEQPQSWDAVHFHSDDLDDCRWESNLVIDLPDKLRSGVYAVRLIGEGVDVERIPLFVEAPVADSQVAVIIPTASYTAYGNDHPGTQGQMAQATASRTPVLLWGDIFMQAHPELGLSCYDAHRDGSGVGYATWRRPMLNMRPTHRYHVGAWQLPADLQLISWLEDQRIDVDVITDHTLHVLGREVLERYSTIMTSTHSEYYTTEMLDAVEGWIDGGGRFLYLGANGFYWRCAFAPDRPWLFELRRGENGSRAWEARPGELYHAFTGERGGLWKFQGRSTHRIFGVGFCSQGFDSSGWYRRLAPSHDQRAAFIFEGVDGETFGHAGAEGGGAAGQEIDRFDVDLGSPVDALILASSEGLSEGYLRAVEEVSYLVSGTSASSDPFVRADVTYFVNDAGGAVFSTGSIAWCGSLGEDDDVSRITRNVIIRFADPTPLPWTSSGRAAG